MSRIRFFLFSILPIVLGILVHWLHSASNRSLDSFQGLCIAIGLCLLSRLWRL